MRLQHYLMRSVAAALVLALCVAPSKCLATLLNPGGSVTNPASSAAPSGAVLATMGPDNIEAIGFFSGTMTSSVIVDPANPFGSNDLTFVYEFEYTGWDANNPNANPISRITVSPFGLPENPITYSTDARWSSLAGGVAPAVIDRPGLGDLVGWTWVLPSMGNGKISLGGNSNLLVVYTNATQYSTGNVSVIGGGVAETPGFAPVPEPTSCVLFGLGAAGLYLAARRRRQIG